MANISVSTFMGLFVAIGASPAHAQKPAAVFDRAALKIAAENGDGRAWFELARNETGPNVKVFYTRAVEAGHAPAIQPLLELLFFVPTGMVIRSRPQGSSPWQ